MNEWTLIELEGFLSREEHEDSFTFTALIPEDKVKGTPAMKAGLGWFTQKNRGLVKASFNPNAAPADMKFVNSVVSEITELYVQLIKEHPTDWPIQILMRKGYATIPSDHTLQKAKTFESISLAVIEELAQTYSLQEIMFLLVSGTENEAHKWLSVLKAIKQEDSSFQYEDALKYIELGIPSTELSVNIHLPFDMVEELYS